MSTFIYADELNQKYIVYGSFYYLKLAGNKLLPCRNRLEIFDRKVDRQVNLLPDAVVIMMNPGGSAPREKDITLPEYKAQAVIQQQEVPLNRVLAKPDTTQYQVMRIMHAKGWKYVRVINLSDIREPKSAVFKKIIEQSAIQKHDQLHSIFSKHRHLERSKVFERHAAAPIILAWGADGFLLNLAQMCFKHCDLTNAKGVASNSSPLLFAHASPTLQAHKERWLEKMFAELGEG